MTGNIHNLKTSEISGDTIVIAPTQIEYIAKIFSNAVADAMNMRSFSAKINKIAEQSLRNALVAAKNQAGK